MSVGRNATSDQLIGLQDIIATVADVTNLSIPANNAEDSRSFMSSLVDGSSIEPRKDLIHHSAMGVFAIRSGDWKLIVGTDGSGDYGRGVHGNGGSRPDPTHRGQLYNLKDDPFELHNLINIETEKVEELSTLLTTYQNRTSSVDNK